MTPNFTILTKEEKLRNELRQEIFQKDALIKEKDAKLVAANKKIAEYESFIDLINSRVKVGRNTNAEATGPGPSSFQ